MKKYLLLALSTAFIIVLSFIYLDKVGASISQTLDVFVYNLIPFLFPMMILTTLFVSLGGAEFLAYPLQYISIPLLRISGNGCVALICSLIGGYPMSMTITNKLVSQNRICIQEQQRIVNYASFASPTFIFGSLGALMDSRSIFCLFLPMVFAGLILLRMSAKDEILNKIHIADIKLNLYTIQHNSTFTELLKQAIILTFKNLVIVLGTILYFTLIANIFTAFAPPKISIFLWGILEFSNASIQIAKMSTSLLNITMLSFIVVFSGLAVILQTIGINEKKDFSTKSFVLAKIIHATFAAAISAILYLFI